MKQIKSKQKEHLRLFLSSAMKLLCCVLFAITLTLFPFSHLRIFLGPRHSKLALTE